jgi:antitoxin (DNA-binding transcriptional repressor) of toxin-antitoxin stability system
MHAMNGDTVLIERFGKPVARLVAIEKDKTSWSEERGLDQSGER